MIISPKLGPKFPKNVYTFTFYNYVCELHELSKRHLSGRFIRYFPSIFQGDFVRTRRSTCGPAARGWIRQWGVPHRRPKAQIVQSQPEKWQAPRGRCHSGSAGIHGIRVAETGAHLAHCASDV